MRVRILNGDNPPLDIQGVHLAWNRRNLYFIPQEERSYSLYFGNENVRAPQYETTRLIPNRPEDLETYDSLEVNGTVTNESYSQRTDSAEIQTWLLYAVVMVLLVALTVWGVMIVKQASPNSES